MLNRWRWTAYSIAHLPVFFPLSIISAQAPLIEGQAYPTSWRCDAEYEVLSNFILEESEAIGISIVHLHNSRSTTDTRERPRSRVESRSSYRVLSRSPFSRVYQNVLDYRTSLLRYASERTGEETGGDGRLVLQIRGWLKSSCGIKTAADNRDGRKRRERKQSNDYSLIVRMHRIHCPLTGPDLLAVDEKQICPRCGPPSLLLVRIAISSWRLLT